MAIFQFRKANPPRQPLFGHGSLLSPTAEHTILDPFGPPLPTIADLSRVLTHTALAAEVAQANNPTEPIIVRPDSYVSEPGQPLPSID